MEAAGTVCADGPVPAIAIAGDPCVDFCGKEADAGNEENPREKFPDWEQHADAGPGVGAAEGSAPPVDGLHPLHGFVAIDLREALRCGRVVEVEELDAVVGVQTADAFGAAAAEITGTIEENGQQGHGMPANWRQLFDS